MYNAQHNETYNPETLFVSGLLGKFILQRILFASNIVSYVLFWMDIFTYFIVLLLKFCAGFLMVQVYECQE